MDTFEKLDIESQIDTLLMYIQRSEYYLATESVQTKKDDVLKNLSIIFDELYTRANKIVVAYRESLKQFDRRMEIVHEKLKSKTISRPYLAVHVPDDTTLSNFFKTSRTMMDSCLNHLSELSDDVLPPMPPDVISKIKDLVDIHETNDNLRMIRIRSEFSLPKHGRTLEDLGYNLLDIRQIVHQIDSFRSDLDKVLTAKIVAANAVKHARDQIATLSTDDVDFAKKKKHIRDIRHTFLKIMHMTHVMYFVVMVRMARIGEEIVRPI